MQTNKRSVRVIVKADAVIKLLKSLNGNPNTEVEMVVDVDDNKSTYKALSSPDVIDWDFIDEDDKCKDEQANSESSDEGDSCDKAYAPKDEKVEVEKITEKKQLNECPKEDEKDNEFYFPNYTLISTIGTEGLIRVIEAAWIIARDTPGIRFGSRLFEEKFKATWNYLTHTEYLKTDLNKSTTRAMMKLLIDVFYNTPTMENELEEAYNDTIARIDENYNSLKSAETLNQVMNILYRA